jgi:plastocyanin
VGAVVLAGCGGGSGGSGGSTDGATPADVVTRGDDALRFDQTQYAAKAGSVEIELIDDGSQPHTLLIEKVSGFKKLSVTKKGDTARGTATLEPGTYTIYCDVVGHRGAGMEAKLIVS